MYTVEVGNPEEVYDKLEDKVFEVFKILDLIDCYPQSNLTGTEKNLRRLIRKRILDVGNDILDYVKDLLCVT